MLRSEEKFGKNIIINMEVRIEKELLNGIGKLKTIFGLNY